MEKRSLLLGMGIGIIGATLLLQLVAPTPQPSPSSKANPAPSASEPAPTQAALTEAEVKGWAKDHGFALIKENEWQAKLQKLKEMESTAKGKVVTTIHVPSGTGSKEIERMLVQAGLLPKQNQFSKLIQERGLARKMRSGSFTFEGQPTEEMIIEKITR